VQKKTGAGGKEKRLRKRVAEEELTQTFVSYNCRVRRSARGAEWQVSTERDVRTGTGSDTGGCAAVHRGAST